MTKNQVGGRHGGIKVLLWYRENGEGKREPVGGQRIVESKTFEGGVFKDQGGGG